MLQKKSILQRCTLLCTVAVLLLVTGSSRFTLNHTLVTAEALPAIDSAPENNIGVLAFSKTEGFRHNSIEPAIQFLENTATTRNWNLVETEDATVFTDENLANFDVVIFLLTTGDVLDANQQAAFERFIQAGGGYAGIHSASDTEYDWDWYGDLVGAYFNDHPAIQTAEINRSDQQHPSTKFLPTPWVLNDEWYNFKTNPSNNNNIKVLLRLDESTYIGGQMDDHPITWSQFYDGGRSWYTGIGHRSEHYTSTGDTLFQQHVIAGIEWAADKEDTPIDPNTLTQKIYLPHVLALH